MWYNIYSLIKGGKTMIIMCAWCRKIIRTDKPYNDLRISHGICDKCHKKYFKGGKKDKENKFLKEHKNE